MGSSVLKAYLELSKIKEREEKQPVKIIASYSIISDHLPSSIQKMEYHNFSGEIVLQVTPSLFWDLISLIREEKKYGVTDNGTIYKKGLLGKKILIAETNMREAYSSNQPLTLTLHSEEVCKLIDKLVNEKKY